MKPTFWEDKKFNVKILKSFSSKVTKFLKTGLPDYRLSIELNHKKQCPKQQFWIFDRSDVTKMDLLSAKWYFNFLHLE